MGPRDAGEHPATPNRGGTLAATAFRFLLSGAANTLATLALYWLLLRFMHYQWAYLISFCAGIGLSYGLNTRFVFRAEHSWRKFAVFPLIYLTTYALGALVLRFSVHTLSVPAAIAPLTSIAATLPVSFILSKLLLQPRKPAA